MKMICKKCNMDIMSDDKIAICPGCGESYDFNIVSDKYEIKMLNGLKISELSYNDVKEGVKNGRFLSYDYITAEGKPWIKLKDSEFGEFFPNVLFDSKKTIDKKRNWFYLFVISFVANIVMLICIIGLIIYR